MSAVSQWAQYSTPDDFWPLAILLIILCSIGFIFGFYYFIRRRVLQNIPTSKIRSAAQGYLELVGQGRLLEGPEIIAPLTGKICTWYSYMIQERRRSGKNNQWVTINQVVSEGLFQLTDDTGQCVIDPDGASVVPSETNTWYGTSPWPVRGTNGRSNFISGGRYRYTEKRMHPGDDLYAIGFYQTVGGANSVINMNTEIIALIREWKADSNLLLKKFDHNKDGRIDMHEWETVRKTALDEVIRRHDEFKSAPPVNLMGNTNDIRRPYILSAVSQDRLINSYKYYTYGLISLFFISGSLVTWLLNIRYSGG